MIFSYYAALLFTPHLPPSPEYYLYYEKEGPPCPYFINITLYYFLYFYIIE